VSTYHSKGQEECGGPVVSSNPRFSVGKQRWSSEASSRGTLGTTHCWAFIAKRACNR
jgi:hypothetical protein